MKRMIRQLYHRLCVPRIHRFKLSVKACKFEVVHRKGICSSHVTDLRIYTDGVDDLHMWLKQSCVGAYDIFFVDYEMATVKAFVDTWVQQFKTLGIKGAGPPDDIMGYFLISFSHQADATLFRLSFDGATMEQ